MTALPDLYAPIFYVYEHWRPGENAPFYVGKGKGEWAYKFTWGRSRHHKRVVAELSNLGLKPETRIISNNLLEHEALRLEKTRITFWRAAGAPLVNKTEGGEGETNVVRRAKLIATICKSVRAARALAGLTQRELAKAANISFATLNAVERGRGDPKSSTLRAIEEALEKAGVEISQNGGVRPKQG